MKIVVGGQIDKEDIAAIVKKELGDQAEVTVKGDLDATMGMKAGTWDYYVGACNTGGGGALAMAPCDSGEGEMRDTVHAGKNPQRRGNQTGGQRRKGGVWLYGSA